MIYLRKVKAYEFFFFINSLAKKLKVLAKAKGFNRKRI